MRLRANDAFAQKVLNKLIKSYTRDERPFDGKWHVYDLLFPRKTVACKKYGCKPTRKDIGFFFTGRAYHSEIQRIIGIAKAEVRGERWGIVGTMDYKGENAIEIKTSRKWTVPTTPEGHYVRQAGYYATLFDLDEVIILVVYPTAGRTWQGKTASTVEMRAWTLQVSKADRKKIHYDMMRTKEELEDALANKRKKVDWDAFPPCPAWAVERFGRKVPSGFRKKDEAEHRKHPFWYAYTEKGWL